MAAVLALYEDVLADGAALALPAAARMIFLVHGAATIAGRAAWSGMTETECRELLFWASSVNEMVRDDDGPDKFNATFDSGWRFGIANPLPPPHDRDANAAPLIDVAAIEASVKVKTAAPIIAKHDLAGLQRRPLRWRA